MHDFTQELTNRLIIRNKVGFITHMGDATSTESGIESKVGWIQLADRYEHLPIYKQAMDVAVHFEKVVAGFSRYHKYTLGTELRNKSHEVVALIIISDSINLARKRLTI